MSYEIFGKREKYRLVLRDLPSDIEIARNRFINSHFLEAFDIYEQLVAAYPKEAYAVLAEVYDCYQKLPYRDRFNLYQARFYNFGITSYDKVLDIGSGHIPFPLATHLSDITLHDHKYGRAGMPFKHVEGKTVFECTIEDMPFCDQEFDFVYCSHVLEHVYDPQKACDELMRVAKRGFIETPSKGKDIFFNSAKVSNHAWGVEAIDCKLFFTPYTAEEIEALQCDIILNMHCAPQTQREKALSALVYLKADLMNTMLLWNQKFEYEVRQIAQTHKTFAMSGSDIEMKSENTSFPKFSFITIVLNGMPFIEYAIKGIYEFAHDIIIVEGAVKECAFAANPDGSSTDGTVECIRNLPDPYNKIRVIQGIWDEKNDMQNEALKHVTGDYVWLVDSDEFYRKEDLYKVRDLIKNDPKITQINVIGDNFWKGFDYIFESPKFFENAAHWRRIFKYVPGARFITHRPPTMVWPGADRSTEQIQLIDGTTTRKMGIYPYHYSYVFEAQVKQKIELYRRYGWGKGWGINLERWYSDFYIRWTPENRNDGCNLNCIMCGGKKKAHEQHVMSLTDFSDHLLPMLRGAKHYQFGCGCEPLLVPYFSDAVAMLPEQADIGPQGRMVTNATLMSTRNIHAIIDRGIFRRILISMDGATSSVYEQIRRGAKFNTVIKNLQSLVARAKEMSSSASIELLFTMLRENYRELPEIVRLASRLGIRRICTHKRAPNDIAFVDDEFYENVTAVIAQAQEIARQLDMEVVDPGYVPARRYEEIQNTKAARPRQCSFSLNTSIDFIIDCKGFITTPCRRLGKPIGNILQATIEEIAAGETFQRLIACIDTLDEQACTLCYLFKEVSAFIIYPRSKRATTFATDTSVMTNVIDAIGALKVEFSTSPTILAIETGTIRSYNENHESTRHISQALGNRGKLISVDCNPESLLISRDICRNASNVTWIESLSIPFLEASCHMRFHFALLDSANDRDLIFEEFRLVVPLMVENGIIIIDDAGISVDGNAIDTKVAAQKGHKVWEFLVRFGVPFDVLPTPGGHGSQMEIRMTKESIDRIITALDGPSGKVKNTTPGDVCKPRNIKVAGEVDSSYDLTAVDRESEFARVIKELFATIRPTKIIETGTYLGEGTTLVIAATLRELGLINTIFYSIECNLQNYQQALKNLSRRNFLKYVKALNGISVPRNQLPTLQEIEERCVNNIEYDDIFVDHQAMERAYLYYKETDFAGIPDDLLGQCLHSFNYRPDFVLLDSGGHMGNIEFNYLISQLQGSCHIAIDDIYHIKHHKSFRQIQNDPRFQIIISSQEKFGFCIAKFTPQPQKPAEEVRRIIWLRPDSIGDNILASSMLPHIKEKYSDAKISVLCQNHISELYESSPFVDAVIGFDKIKGNQDEAYRNFIVQKLRAVHAGLVLNSVYSRDPLYDLFAINSGARTSVAFNGNLCNISADVRDTNNAHYTTVITDNEAHKPELERHRDFLQGSGIQVLKLEPTIWLKAEDEEFAEKFFKDNNLDSKSTVCLFAGAQSSARIYQSYGIALPEICKSHGLSVIGLGGSVDSEINIQNLDATGARIINLSGITTLRQSAAILKRCRLALGAETGLAHMACAVGTPNVILLGGGHFGRFMPYSPLTSTVCLPLECYCCNWKCRYDRVHCIKDINPEVIAEAIRQTLKKKSEKARVFVQGTSLWEDLPQRPKWKWFNEYLDINTVEIIPVGAVPSIPKTTIEHYKNFQEYITSGNFDAAISELEKLLVVYPAFALAHNDLGVIYYNKGDKERALKYYEQAVALKPENINFQKNLADFYFVELGRNEDAIQIYIKVLAAHPEDIDALLAIGKFCVTVEKMEEAKVFFNRVLAVEPQNSSAIQGLNAVLNHRFAKTSFTHNTLSKSNLPHPKTNSLPNNQYANISEANSKAVDVSIILATKNRAVLLEQMLNSLKETAKQIKYEIIAIEGDSNDNTVQILHNYGAVVFSESTAMGPGRHSWPQLYNFGFAKARGRWGMYASDDIVFGEGSLHNAVTILDGLPRETAGGIFFYRDLYPETSDWGDYGICFSVGQHFLMNYGLIRMDFFREAKGLDEGYYFYQADSDLSLKAAAAGRHLVPLPGCFLAHNNKLDQMKSVNQEYGRRDTERLVGKWQGTLPVFLPAPHRLMYVESFRLAFDLPHMINPTPSGIKEFWHGIAFMQQGNHSAALDRFTHAIEGLCDHWIVRWYMSVALVALGKPRDAEKFLEIVCTASPSFVEARELMARITKRCDVGAQGDSILDSSAHSLAAPSRGSSRTLVLQIWYGGLGDHLFYSHLPRLAKQTGAYDRVFISNQSAYRHDAYRRLIWEMNPFVDGFSDDAGFYPEFAEVEAGMNLLDKIMLLQGIDDGKRFHEPEIYFRPKTLVSLADSVVYDPNYISYVGDVAPEAIPRYLEKHQVRVDFQMKLRDKSRPAVDFGATIETPDLEGFCSVLMSCKDLFCLASGTATLAAALGKPAKVFFGTGQKRMFHHSLNHSYIQVYP